MALAALPTCGDPVVSADPVDRTAAEVSADEAFRAMVSNEETIAELVSPLNRIARSVRDLRLPGHAASGVFAPDAMAIDLVAPEATVVDAQLPIRHHEWKVAVDETPATDVWAPLWEEARSFEHAGFGVLRGGEGDDGAFVTELKFSARGAVRAGGVAAWKGKVEAHWRRVDDGWQVVRWVTKELHADMAAAPLFDEVLAQAIPDRAERSRARESVHERYIREVFFTGGTTFTYPKDYWPYVISWDSLDQHTSVSVVDIDGDGWDDFYVTARWGKNQLWRNRGDGTFEDVAARVGLDIDGMCNAALFADFDNDGDPDAFIGRSLERGRYYTNSGGVFIERTEASVGAPLPHWTSSMAAADVNGDGLLDLYISTYRLPITKPQNVLATGFLDPEEQDEWKRRRAGDHPVFRLTGPPNVLLFNRGGGTFERAPDAGGAALWLSSFQGTFADYDNDGDPDLFVANDYAPDNIFRNDGGTFTDVTAELAGDELQGFGMGVSLGDYDNDGRQDPFFTYMYSKAGSRITAMIDGLEPRMYEGVAGNKLLKNTPDGFRTVSGNDENAMQVAVSGWSWGGQYADLDNDGFLDLYVANGLYTPPAGAATEVDL